MTVDSELEQKYQLDVVCLGIFVADALGRPVHRVPEWRQLELLEQVELQAGGCANNTAMGLARLGFRVGAIGKVGDDGFGDFILKQLASEGVDVCGVRRDASANTSFTFVMIAPDGERAFFHYIGANGALAFEDIDFDILKSARILHVGGSFVLPGLDGAPTAEVLRRAKEIGIVTSLDTVWNGGIDAYETLRPSLPHLDYFLPSIDEARLITGRDTPEQIAEFLLQRGVGTVGLKMGAEGSYLRSSREEVRTPAFQIDAIDTSGAGDAWVAGFLAGVSRGLTLEQCGRLGSAMGALCTTALGTTAGLKNWDETASFLNHAQQR